MSTATDRKPPPVEDIEQSLDGFFARLGRSWKTILIVGLVLSLIWFIVMPNLGSWGQYILYGAMMLFQLLFAVFFMIVQFAALFYFLGRPRIYWIYPGETGVGFKDYRGNPEV